MRVIVYVDNEPLAHLLSVGIRFRRLPERVYNHLPCENLSFHMVLAKIDN